MAEDWDFYVSLVDDHPASIFVDLEQARTAPDAKRPHLLRVTVVLKNPRDDGLSDDAESEVLYAIEDELYAMVAQILGARYVGRITCQGRRDHFYYGASAEGLRAAVERAFENFAGYEFETSDRPDPDWETYFNLLFPSRVDMQSIFNRRLVQQLTEQGVDLSMPREVEHFAYFPSVESRQRFVSQVEPEGFRVELCEAEAPDAEFRHGVCFTRSDRVDFEIIDGIVIDLFLRAEGCGGEYDGWGTALVS
jgi:uncharacterized protein (TIGR01619 family)